MSQKKEGLPVELSNIAFADCSVLLDFGKCWQECRKGNMLPLKRDFEGAVLDYPDLVPNMTMVELGADGQLNYLFIGGDRAARRNREDTGQLVSQTLAPAAADLMAHYALVAFDKPFDMYWEQHNILPSGAVAHDRNLGVVLRDDKDKPCAIAIAASIDTVYDQEMVKGEYMLGSGGMAVTPIDIGLGVPDLPREVGPS